MIKTVCLLALLLPASLSQSCNSNLPTAYMCQPSSVRGRNVTLDVSTAADSNYSSCVCTLALNGTGFVLEFDEHPNSSDCGAKLDIMLSDLSMQMKCGAPAGRQSTGSFANVVYTRDTSVEDVDSRYCLSFYSDHTELTLTCTPGTQQNDTTTVTSPMSTTTTTPSNTSSIILTSTTISSTTHNSLTTSTMNTTVSTLTVFTTNTTPSQSNLTTQSTQVSSTAHMSETNATSIVSSVNVTYSNTTKTSTSGPVTTATLATPGENSTSGSNQTTTQFQATLSVNQSNTTSLSSTSDRTTTQIFQNSSTTQTTKFLNDSTATTTTTMHPSNFSTTQVSTTNQSNSSIYQKVTPSPFDSTTVLTSTQSTLSTTTDQIIKLPVSNSTTVNSTQVTKSANITISNVNSSITTGSTTASTIALTVLSQTTTEMFNSSHETPNSTLSNTTTTLTSVRNTNSTPISNITSTPVSNTTTTSVSNTTTTPVSNTTTPVDNTTLTSISNTTLTSESNTASTTSSNSTDITTQINIDETTTDIDANETTTIDFYPNATTIQSNAPTDHSTNDVNTTAAGNTTKPGFWEPPFQEYGVPSRSNNIVVILVPLACVILLIFVAVAVYVMCKRSKEAARKTTIDKEKADKNDNFQRRPNFLERNTDSQEKSTLKSDNPVDNFTVKTHNTPTKNNNLNETNEINGLHRKESVTLSRTDSYTHPPAKLTRTDSYSKTNGNSLTETGKPKIYEPTERERDILDNLELSAIVLEHDPDDPNRYFKKGDPGDWYRVIMKGKKPRDSESLLNTSDSTKGRSRRKKTKSSASEENSDKNQRHHRRHGSERSESRSREREHRKTSKRRSSSSDSFDKTLSDSDQYPKVSRVQTNDVKSNKKPTVHNDNRLVHESAEADKATQPKIIISKPVNNESLHTSSKVVNQPKQVTNKINEKVKDKEPMQTKVIISKPSERPQEKVQIQTRMTANKPSSVTTPGSVQKPNTAGNVIHGNYKTPEKKDNRRDSISSFSSISSSEATPFQDRNTPQRLSHSRNSIFGSGGKFVPKSVDAKEDKDGGNTKPVKRPDIVPPLNLTGSGDKVGRADDGFEEFILN